MAYSKHGIWTVIFPDRAIYKKTGADGDSGKNKTYININSPIWTDPKFQGVHAIQYTNDNQDNDQVEFNDGRDNDIYNEVTFGSFQQFIDVFNIEHLKDLQNIWDNDNAEVEADGILSDETLEEKIVRIGARPTSYSS